MKSNNSIKIRNFAVYAIFAISILMVAMQLKTPDKNSFRITGSYTVRPITEKISRIYENKYKNRVFAQTASKKKVLAGVLSGSSDIGFVLGDLNSKEKEKLNYIPVRSQAVVMIVNSENPVNELSKKQIIDIYTRKIKNWKEISSWEQPVLISSQKTESDSAELFEEYSGLKNPTEREKGINGYISDDTHITNSELESVGFAGRIPGAIAFTSMEDAIYSQNKGIPIKILTLDGIKLSKLTVSTRKYPIMSELNIVYKKNNKKVEGFLNNALKDTEILKIFETPQLKNLY